MSYYYLPYGGLISGCDPRDISDLVLWLDASDLSTIAQTGGNVSQWDDKSGQGNDAVQGTGSAQPTTNNLTQNGLNVIEFNGTSDFMTIPSTSDFDIASTSVTLIAVHSIITTGTTKRIYNTESNTEDAGWSVGVNSSDRLQLRTYNNITTSAIATNSDSNHGGAGFVCSSARLNLSNGNVKMQIDGVDDKDSGNHIEYVDSSLDFHIGAYAQSSGAFTELDLCELIVYQRVLDDTELETTTDYLLNKWGI